MDRTRPTHAIWLLLAATLLLRALVPAGWMPDVDRSDAIVAKMCNSAMTVTIPLGRARARQFVININRSALTVGVKKQA